jgi:hypothetical protein
MRDKKRRRQKSPIHNFNGAERLGGTTYSFKRSSQERREYAVAVGAKLFDFVLCSSDVLVSLAGGVFVARGRNRCFVKVEGNGRCVCGRRECALRQHVQGCDFSPKSRPKTMRSLLSLKTAAIRGLCTGPVLKIKE